MAGCYNLKYFLLTYKSLLHTKLHTTEETGMRSIRSKFKLLIILTAIIFTVSAAVILLHNFYTLKRTKEIYSRHQSLLIQNLIEIQSRVSDKNLKDLAENPQYSPCNLINNLTKMPSGNLQGFDYLCISDSALIPILIFPDTASAFIRTLPQNNTELSKILSDGNITRFYGWAGNSLIRVSVIKTSWCNNSGSAKYAWIFAGERINGTESQVLASMTGGEVVFRKEPADTRSDEPKAGHIRTSLPLIGSNNLPVASINYDFISKPLSELKRYQQGVVMTIVLFFLSYIIFLALFVRQYYLLPLKLINLAFRHKDPEMLRTTGNSDKDLSLLKSFMMNVFSQEKMLNDMVKQRSAHNLNAFHAALLYQISDAVFATDHKGVITYWNGSAEELYEISEKEAIAKTAEELISTKWEKDSDAKLTSNKFNANGISRGLVNQLTCKGHKVKADAAVTYLLDCNGSLMGQLFVMRQIKE